MTTTGTTAPNEWPQDAEPGTNVWDLNKVRDLIGDVERQMESQHSLTIYVAPRIKHGTSTMNYKQMSVTQAVELLFRIAQQMQLPLTDAIGREQFATEGEDTSSL